jgi:hypothetical protein
VFPPVLLPHLVYAIYIPCSERNSSSKAADTTLIVAENKLMAGEMRQNRQSQVGYKSVGQVSARGEAFQGQKFKTPS